VLWRHTLRLMRMRPLFIVLAVQLVLGAVFLALVASGTLLSESDSETRAAAKPNRFDGPAAFRILKLQLAYGPRPAGSEPSRKLAVKLRGMLPDGRFQKVPGGLRNVVGTVRGKERGRFVVVGAHYDTKDIPGFVGANDGAGGTAAVVQLARALKPRTIGPTVKFVLFDGEESPRGASNSQFFARGLRGSKVAARKYRKAEAMILLDFVADRDLSIPQEATSNFKLWRKLRAAATRAGVARHFPDEVTAEVLDDHTPFQRQGVPAIDLIDFDFACFHKTCDDLPAVSEKSLDASGEAVAHLLPTL
jgi:glutaminyl-peptide cyclotransferase